MSTIIFGCCVQQKDVTRSRGKATGQGFRRAKPPEAKTILAFERSTKAANLIGPLGRQKVKRRLCCFAKMTFYKSNFGMCMVTFITIIISPGGSRRRQGQKHGGQLLPFPPSGAAHDADNARLWKNGLYCDFLCLNCVSNIM